MNTLIASYFGMLRTLSENSWISGNTTTGIGFISLWTGTRPMKLVVFTSRYTQNSVTIPGYRTAMDLCRHQLPHK